MSEANPTTHKLDELKAKLEGFHRDHPQRAMLATLAMDSIQGALVELAKLGHRFHLVPAEGPAPAPYPKMLYHAKLGEAVVNDADEETALGNEWEEHPGFKAVPAAAPLPAEELIGRAPTYQPPANLVGMVAAGQPPPGPVEDAVPGGTYPKMLYKRHPDGSVESLVIPDEGAEASARLESFGTRPDGQPGPDEVHD